MINIGDLVDVWITPHKLIIGKVLYVPQATGDCWHIETLAKEEVYIQQFLYIRKLKYD